MPRHPASPGRVGSKPPHWVVLPCWDARLRTVARHQPETAGSSQQPRALTGAPIRSGVLPGYEQRNWKPWLPGYWQPTGRDPGCWIFLGQPLHRSPLPQRNEPVAGKAGLPLPAPIPLAEKRPAGKPPPGPAAGLVATSCWPWPSWLNPACWQPGYFLQPLNEKRSGREPQVPARSSHAVPLLHWLPCCVKQL